MLVISTFNIKNDYYKYNKEKTKDIINYLKNNQIDILNLQEVYKRLDKDLRKEIKNNNYRIIGKYRFLSRIILKPFNESTPIITNKKIVETKNYKLPHFPSLQNRIMTKIVINYNNELISIYNTHLDFKYDKVKKKELDKIFKIISKDNNKIILTGDFNLKINKEIFNIFIEKLEKLGIIRIPLDEKTLKQSMYNRAIDHVFISKEFKIVDKEVIKTLEISDHYPLLIKLK